MESPGIFSETVAILKKVLDLRSVRHNLIASNIANIDTPNYKAFDLIMDEELENILGTEKNIKLTKTQPGHLPGREIRLDNVKPKAVAIPPLTLRGDRNSVDVDRVMAKLAENNLMYNALAQILSKKFVGLKNVIQGGGK